MAHDVYHTDKSNSEMAVLPDQQDFSSCAQPGARWGAPGPAAESRRLGGAPRPAQHPVCVCVRACVRVRACLRALANNGITTIEIMHIIACSLSKTADVRQRKVEVDLSHGRNNAVQALVVREEAIGDHKLRPRWQPCTVQSNTKHAGLLSLCAIISSICWQLLRIACLASITCSVWSGAFMFCFGTFPPLDSLVICSVHLALLS